MREKDIKEKERCRLSFHHAGGVVTRMKVKNSNKKMMSILPIPLCMTSRNSVIMKIFRIGMNVNIMLICLTFVIIILAR